MTDEEDEVVQYSFYGTGVDFGLLQKVERDPTGLDLETTYGYDSAWNVDSVTSPEGHETTYEFDNLRRMTKMTAPSPLSYDTKYEYDANGNRAKMEVENVDEDGDPHTNAWLTTTYTFTNENRLQTHLLPIPCRYWLQWVELSLQVVRCRRSGKPLRREHRSLA